jgi:hypothetical protein
MCGTRPLPAIYISLRDVCTCQPIGYAIALNNHKATRPFALAAHICMAGVLWFQDVRPDQSLSVSPAPAPARRDSGVAGA